MPVVEQFSTTLFSPSNSEKITPGWSMLKPGRGVGLEMAVEIALKHP